MFLGMEWYWWLIIVIVVVIAIPFKVKFMKWWGKHQQEKNKKINGVVKNDNGSKNNFFL